MSEPAISARGLRKSYGANEAVKGLDFEVQTGEVFGLLGPNGAGKTSTVEILEGLRPRTGGDVTVLGFDPDKQKQALKDRIGVCLQATNLPDKITVHEAHGAVRFVLHEKTSMATHSCAGCSSGKNGTPVTRLCPAVRNSDSRSPSR